MNRAPTSTKYFYQLDKLVTAHTDGQTRRAFRITDQPLAEQASSNRWKILAADENRSISQVHDDINIQYLNYAPYGYSPSLPSPKTIYGFNGETIDPQTQNYLLGLGYRVFNPVLFRFHSADNFSPFEAGGLNAYAYCEGDPVNKADPTGQSGVFLRLLKGIGNRLGLRRPGTATKVAKPNSMPVSRAASEHSGALTYASLDSRSSRNSISSDYASIDSYSSTESAPPLPHRPPPSSAGPSGQLSTSNPNREPTGRVSEDIAAWINNTTSDVAQDLLTFSQIPRAGAQANRRHLSVQNAGIRRSESFLRHAQSSSERPLSLYSDGGLFRWRDRRR
ncbi:RHS repeat-associated core domain-containing protein [Pseudomonas sp. RV120224-01c]